MIIQWNPFNWYNDGFYTQERPTFSLPKILLFIILIKKMHKIKACPLSHIIIGSYKMKYFLGSAANKNWIFQFDFLSNFGRFSSSIHSAVSSDKWSLKHSLVGLVHFQNIFADQLWQIKDFAVLLITVLSDQLFS